MIRKFIGIQVQGEQIEYLEEIQRISPVVQRLEYFRTSYVESTLLSLVLQSVNVVRLLEYHYISVIIER
jgi:hypothetical protein